MSELEDIFAMPLVIENAMYDLIPDGKEKCGGEGGEPGPCPENGGDDTHKPAAAKLEEATNELGKEVEPAIAKSSKLKEIFNNVKDKVTNIAKSLYAGEAPSWAMEHADVWLYEGQLNASHGAGSVIAVKVAAFAATKAVLAVKAMFGKAIKGEMDTEAAAKALLAFMQEVGKLTGYAVPTLEQILSNAKPKSKAMHKPKPLAYKSSLPLEEALKAFFKRQGEEILNRIKDGNDLEISQKAPLPTFFELGNATKEMYETMLPLINLYYDHASENTISRLGLDSELLKVVQPNLAQAVQHATFKFCQSTNESTQKELGQAIHQLRQELVEGLEQGEVKNALMRRVQTVFENLEVNQAFIIGVTEANRAQNKAMMITGEASGIVKGYEWFLSENACPVCKEIHARMPIVKAGEAFAEIGNDPVYGKIENPPAHPSCRCSMLEVI